MKKIIAIIFVVSSTIFAQSNNTSSKNLDVFAVQKITVTIGGDFVVNGSFSAIELERVDEFLTRIYIEAQEIALSTARDEYQLVKVKEELAKYSLRNIKLKRFDGSEKILDLKKFRITGNFDENPYLKNNDVIIIPPLDLEHNFIDITGAVNKPIKFQYVEGDKLSDAILFALGINPAYDKVEKAEISRLSTDGENEEIITVNITDDFLLQRGDRINILAEKINKLSYKSLVIGEVNRPGYIHITKNNTTLKEVIEKAGGIKSNAWLKKAQLIRGAATATFNKDYQYIEDKFKEIERKLKYDEMINIRMSNLTLEDTLYFKLENELLFYNEFGMMDLTDLINPESETSNTIVKDGDVIIIPEFENTISVFGQVPHTGKYPFEKGMDYKYYITKAGGFGEEAEEDVMIIKANSKNWIEADDEEAKIEPGDIIWIPKTPQRGLDFYLKNIGGFASVISAIATIVLIIVQASK